MFYTDPDGTHWFTAWPVTFGPPDHDNPPTEETWFAPQGPFTTATEAHKGLQRGRTRTGTPCICGTMTECGTVARRSADVLIAGQALQTRDPFNGEPPDMDALVPSEGWRTFTDGLMSVYSCPHGDL